MCRYYLSDDREAQSAPAPIASASLIETDEALEHALALAVGDAWPVVIDGKYNAAFLLRHGKGDAAASMVRGVLAEVAERPPKRSRVAADPCRRYLAGIDPQVR
jgi:hypothetical protein